MMKKRVPAFFDYPKNYIPHPNGSNWDAIKAVYPECNAVPIDQVVSKVTFPKGWKIVIISDDATSRLAKVYDANEQEVMLYSLRKSTCRYYGKIHYIKLG